MLAAQMPFGQLQRYYVIRMKPGNDADAVLNTARQAILETSSTLAVKDMTTMRRVFDDAVGPALQLMGLLVLLGGLALLLGAIGVYGVVSHFVTRRKREWSIRMALGLRPSQLIAQIVTRGGALVTAGVVAGITIAVGTVRVLSTFLYGVKPMDGMSLVSAMATLVAAGLIAALIPAWRASRADPARVLREQ
jgi:ABC-type antimicrobial peptide transport system permease subunit